MITRFSNGCERRPDPAENAPRRWQCSGCRQVWKLRQRPDGTWYWLLLDEVAT